MKDAFSDFMVLFDVNMNGRIEVDEHVRYLKVHGFTSDIDDMTFFKMAYNNTDSATFDDVIEMWLQFGADTSTNANNDTVDQAIRTVSHEEL